MSQSTVNCVIQDKKGFIWIGTQDGLNRYDGHDFVHFKKTNDSNSIPDNFVQSLFEDSKGNIWVGTYGGGIAIYNPQKNSYKRLNTSNSNLSDDIIMCFAEYENNLFIGTKRGGLNTFNTETGKLTSILLSDTTSQIQIRDLSIFNDKLYIASNLGGIHNYDSKSIIIQFDSVQIQCLSTENKSLLATSLNGGIYQLNKDNSCKSIIKESLKGKEIWGITKGENDKLWVGTFGDGLFEIDSENNQKSTNYKSSKQDINSINHDVILTVFKDDNGGIWIGTLGGGVNYFEPDNQKFMHYNEINGLSNNVVMSFLEMNNNLYIGTFGGGLNKFSLKNSAFQKIDNVNGQIVRCIYKDRNKNIWIGTYGNGLIKYNPLNDKSEYILNNVIDDVWCIKKGKGDIIWLGTWGSGLIKYNVKDGSYKQYLKTEGNSISENTVLSIDIDTKGNLWLGTYGSGLNYFDVETDNFINYSFDVENGEGTNNKKIRNLFIDNDNLLIGTDGGGLNIYNSKTEKFKYYTTEDGLPNNVIYGLAKDNENNFWITSNYGLSKFNLNTKSFLNFDYDDGLQNNEFNQGAILFGDENIYIGGIDGFNIFKPKNIKEEHSNSNTVITSMKVSGEEYYEPILYLDELTLEHTNNFLSFQFSNLDYSGESIYRCQLEGLDKEWIYLDHRNFINYTNLPPGEYKLNYQGKRNGEWSNNFETLLISIPPPFWKTIWFYVVSIFIFFFLLYAIYINKQRNLKLRNIDLENQVKNRTHEIDLKNEILERKNKDITDSLNYAKNIQESILPSSEILSKYLPQHFIFYKPKDIVSGDFYWAHSNGDEIIFAVVDCTGHGVPGAFMSIIGSNGLQKAVVEEKLYQPNIILDSLNSYIKNSVKLEDGYIRDGMDIAICNLNIITNKLQYAGAFNSLLLIQNNELVEIKADRNIIGSTSKKYSNNSLEVKEGDCFYIFTDGFADQFGGDNDKKFNFPKFREMLFENHQEDGEKQHEIIENTFNNWKGNRDQIDDICIMGVKI